MAALLSYPQELFAVDSGAQGTSVFGSIAGGSVAYSFNPTTLQSAAWFDGWIDAVLDAGVKRLPTLEDMNSVHYVLSYNIAYLQQEGIGVWNSGIEYRLNSIVKKDGTSQLFISIQNSNTNHALTDGAWWTQCGDLQYIPASAALLASGLGSVTQAYNAGLTSIAGLTTAANKMIYTTALNTYAVTDLTSFGRSIVALTDATAAQTLFGTIITSWVSYTPTVSNLGAGSGTCTGFWRRVGDTMEIMFFFSKDGTPGSGTNPVTFSIPPTYTINTAKLPTTVNTCLGTAFSNGLSGSQNNFITSGVLYSSNTTFAIGSTNSGGDATYEGGSFRAPSDVSGKLSIPIVGW